MRRDVPLPGLPRRLLNAGSGFRSARPLPAPFDRPGWSETTLDIDPATRPDILASLTDMRAAVPDGGFDAVLSSHSLEHLHDFEVVEALREFRRILRRDGFVLATCPDIEAVAEALVRHGLDHVAYVAPVGPITLHDILFGHSRSIREGAPAMAHRTGFTARRLGEMAMEAGFAAVAVGCGAAYDLWAIFEMPDTDQRALAAELAGTPAAVLYHGTTGEEGR